MGIGGDRVYISANATFTCSAGGVHVPLTVTASNGQCSKSLTTTVSCGNINCGDGLKTPDEACDPKLSVDNCGRDCLPITSTTCLACEQTSDCAEFTDCFQLSGNGAPGTPGAGIPKAQMCNEVLDCVRDSGCGHTDTLPPFTLIQCYCGTASPSDCQNGLGNGACKAELERGLETVEFGPILQRLKNTFFGGGLAMARVDCDSQLCQSECGFH